MNVPILPTHPTELILAVTAEHATGGDIRSTSIPSDNDTNLHPPLFSMLFEHLGHSRVLALIHCAVPASSLVFFCHMLTQ